MEDMIDAAPAAGPAVSSPSPIRVIRRQDMPQLTTVVVNGREHRLGILKDFRKHPDLAAFLPEDARLSLAWVHLDAGEVLAVHEHPTASMIIVGHGHGEAMGDVDASIADGDIVIIPPGRPHGFRGAPPDGLWALSVQFEGDGLYEQASQPRVRFEASGRGAVHPLYHELLARNERFGRAFVDSNPIHAWLESGRLADARDRERFFDAVQVFSRYFQRAMFARSATVDDPRFEQPFRSHLAEEYGHDERLAADVGHRSSVWDPLLEAASNWFVWKMVTLDNAEKVVLSSLVLEVSSDLVSRHGQAVFPGIPYFEVHAEADSGHQQVGMPLLENLETAAYSRLFQVQQEGWDMLNVMAARIAALADGH